MLNIDSVITVYNLFLSNFQTIKYIVDDIFSKARYLVNDREVNITSKKERRDFYYMANFYNNYFIYFRELSNKLVNNENEPLSSFIDYFLQVNKLFNISIDYAKELITSLLTVTDGFVDITKVFKFYDKKYAVKVEALDYIKITFEYLAGLFNKMIKIFYINFELVDVNGNGYLNFLEFEKFVMLILGDQKEEIKWKIKDYFVYFYN